jgi:hypothetical protein
MCVFCNLVVFVCIIAWISDCPLIIEGRRGNFMLIWITLRVHVFGGDPMSHVHLDKIWPKGIVVILSSVRLSTISCQLLQFSSDLDTNWHKARWWWVDEHVIGIFWFVVFLKELWPLTLISPKFLVNTTPLTFLNRFLCILAEGFSVHCTAILSYSGNICTVKLLLILLYI